MESLGHKQRVFQISNQKRNMQLWIANGVWGLHFIVDGRHHGGVIYRFFRYPTWRHKLFNAGIAWATNSHMQDRII